MWARAIRGRPVEVAALVLIVVVAAVVRLAFIGPPVRYDEVFSFQQYAFQPWHHIVTDYTYPNNHILHSLAVHAVWRVFGGAAEVLRLPACLAGILLVPATYVLGRLLYDRTAGLWAAALVAGSSLLIQYSTNGRGYTMGMVLVVTAIAAATWAVRGRGSWAWVLLGVSSLLAVYTVPTMAGGIAIAFGWGLAAIVAEARRERVSPWRPLGSLAVTGAAAALAGVLLYLPTRGDSAWSSPADFGVRKASEKAGVVQATWEQWNDGLPLPLQLVLVAGFLAALAGHRRIAREPLPLGVVTVVVTAIAVLVLPQSPLPRTYMYLLPLYLLTAGAGLSFLASLAAERLRVPAARASAALAVVAALALSLAFGLRGEDRYSVDPPRSEKDVAALVRPGRPLMSSVVTGDPLSFYLGGYERGRPPYNVDLLRGHPRRVAVAVATEYDETLPAVLEAAEIAPAPGSHPKLISGGRWIDVYEVALR